MNNRFVFFFICTYMAPPYGGVSGVLMVWALRWRFAFTFLRTRTPRTVLRFVDALPVVARLFTHFTFEKHTDAFDNISSS